MRTEPIAPAAERYARLLDRFVDELLPALKDTEARVLLIVLRQTVRRGKECDWLTHSQLKARTGRASEAVSAAVDTLVRRGLVEVWSEQGLRLSEPAARRRERGCLLYRLGPLVGARRSRLSAAAEKAKTTGIKKQNGRYRKIEVGTSADMEPLGPPIVTTTVETPVTPEQRARIERERRRIRARLATLRR